ncbi:40S ribosomal protein S19 [Candidatus Woesearchaeota archaeon]|nr:40S ribosomal protein S19 [Candidatus Woesearchaeota archaeon]
MVTIYDADIQKSIEKLSDSLKSLVKAPEWTKFVKTGQSKARPPVDSDWFYKRAAAILITIYKRGPIGVSKLRVKYGSKKRRGHNPEKFYIASGKIIRNILQQLDKANLTLYKKEGIIKGRIITAKGKSLVNKNAVIMKNEQ